MNPISADNEAARLAVKQYFKIESVNGLQHFLFNWFNFLCFRKKGYEDGFSIESSPLAVFVVIPYIVFSEAYFLRQRRYFVTLRQKTVGVVAFQQKTETLYISNLAVSPFHRRIGIATYTLNYAALVARQLRKDALELSVNKRNTPALRLYIKHGFRLKEERMRSHILRKNINAQAS